MPCLLLSWIVAAEDKKSRYLSLFSHEKELNLLARHTLNKVATNG